MATEDRRRKAALSQRKRVARGYLAPDDPRHGQNGYINFGCRCDTCRRGNTEGCKKARYKRWKKGLPEGDPRHGRLTSYPNWGCTCEKCLNAVNKRLWELRSGAEPTKGRPPRKYD